MWGPKGTKLTLFSGYMILALTIITVLSSQSSLAAKTPHTLADERHLEESLANRMIKEEDLKENRHLTELLGEDHLFNNANSLLVETSHDNEDDASFAVGYDDSDDVEARNTLSGSLMKSRKSSVTATKKDKLSGTPEESLKSIGFQVDDNDQGSDSVTMTSDSADMQQPLKPKVKAEEAASKKTTMTNSSRKNSKSKETSTSSLGGKKEKSVYEELYDEHEMKAVKETLVSQAKANFAKDSWQPLHSFNNAKLVFDGS